MGLDPPAMINALSIAYGQVCGTMQAHTEGSMLLAMQVGFNARNAVMACDLAARGFDAPKNVLEGPFDYFTLIEASGAPARIAQDFGRRWLITELAHKPILRAGLRTASSRPASSCSGGTGARPTRSSA